jgi:hypothetical protein
MEHDVFEPLAGLVHVGATREVGERIRWGLLTTEQRDVMTGEVVAMLSGFGGAFYAANSPGLTAPGDVAAAVKSQIDARERGETTAGETMARGMPLVMALTRSGSERML